MCWNLLLYTRRTVYEPFKTKPVIATKSEADNRVQSNVSVSHGRYSLKLQEKWVELLR